MLVGILPGHADVVLVVLLRGRVVGDTQQMEVVDHAAGRVGAGVIGAPAPGLRHGAAHTIGQVFERVAVSKHRRIEVVDVGAVDKRIDALGRTADTGEGHLADADEVLLAAGQRALNLEVVYLGQVGIGDVADVPLHLDLGSGNAQGGDGQAVGAVEHGEVLSLGRSILDEILADALRLIVVGYEAELTVRLGGIERDDAAVRRSLHLLADGAVVGVDILVAQLANLLGNHGPGHHDLAHAVVADVGRSDKRRRHGAGFGYRDGLGSLESALLVEIDLITAVAVALHMPAERYLLAPHLLGHHPDGSCAERALVVVADDV